MKNAARHNAAAPGAGCPSQDWRRGNLVSAKRLRATRSPGGTVETQRGFTATAPQATVAGAIGQRGDEMTRIAQIAADLLYLTAATIGAAGIGMIIGETAMRLAM